MEAAFSELLSAVDDKADNVSDNDTDDIDLIAEDSEEVLRSITSPEEACHIVSDTSGKSSPVETRSTLVHESSNTTKLKVSVAGEDFTSEDQKEDVGVICTTPQRTLDRPLLDLTRSPPDNTSAISVIEDDDGSVTVQSVSYSDKGNHTVTEKTRLRRTESRTEEEEKDTIIESKITSPGGSDHYTKDVINTRRKVTSRGSDYFTRSAYNIRKRRDFEGDEIEEQDLNVETENFSVSKGECWGDRAEAKVQVRRTADNSPSVIPEGHGTGVEGEGRSVGNGVTHGRMDISKTSSGYGSVSGSDEEEKEEVPRRGRHAGCPEIKSTLKDVITQDGSTAVLECTVSGSPLPSIVWYKGNKPISTTKHYEPKFDTLTGKASLTVLNATQDYGGEYRCVFRNPLGEAETKSRLTVRSRALKKPSILISLKDQTVTEGQAVCLECKVTDATQIAWYKDGIIQRNSSDFKQTFDGTFAKLEIGEIFLDDTGEYSCIAKNEKGEAKTMCKIRVKEDTGDGDVVPMFLTKPESKIYSSGETIILECDVIGSPKPQITWHRDKQRVGNNSKHRTLYDGRVATLRISQTNPDDSGKYEVVAENCAGKVSVDALIVVKAKQGPPSILHSLADATAKVGKPLILHCDIRGSPVPMILWRKDGRMIGNTADFKQTYENNMARLEIKDVYEQDGGCYECVARNSFGAVSSSCKIIVEGKKPPGETTNKKTDWLVGRDQSNPEDSISKPNEVSKLKGSGVKRSESVKVTSNYPVRDRFRRNLNVQDDQQGAITTQNNEKSNTSHSSPSQQTDSNISQRSTLQKTDSKTKIVKDDVQPAKPVGKEDPPWKNVTLRRTESAKMPNYGRSKPLTWKRDEQSETESKDVSNTNEGKPASSGWRPVSMELKTDFPKPKTEVDKLKTNTQIGLRRSESARALNSNRDIVAKFLTGALEREKDTDRNDELSSDKSQSVRAIHRIKDEEISSKPSYSNQDSDTVEENNNVSDKKLSRSQSMRLLFERKSGKNLPEQDEQQTTVSKSVPSYLARRDAGVRRTSSLKITEKEAGALRSKRQENGVHLDLAPLGKESEDSFTSRRRVWETTPSTQSMPSYDTIDDEEELHKMLSKTENFEERKKIRSRMKEIREKKQQEWESKRAEREKDAGDAVRRKFELAEQEKQRKMKAFDKMAEETSKDRARIQAKSEELLQDKLRHADQEKKRHLQQFDELAKHDEKKTVSKTPAKPSGTQGAKAMFKQMDASSPAPKANGLLSISYAKRAATTMRRNAAAIKQDILNFCQANVQEYEEYGVEITNFSSSWNNGMAFCALIHHFYPDSFDFSQLDPKKRRANFVLAFDTAEKVADIAPLLDVEDMVRMQKPDWKCVFTYVQSFYRKLHTHERNSAAKPAES